MTFPSPDPTTTCRMNNHPALRLRYYGKAFPIVFATSGVSSGATTTARTLDFRFLTHCTEAQSH